MFKQTTLIVTLSIFALCSTNVFAQFNGVPEFTLDNLGYYYMITGGKFPTGTIPNGDNASGGTFRFLLDDPNWGSYALGAWNKDDWFTQNASFALTLKNAGAIVYDNNGIEDGTHGGFYDYTTHLPENNWTTPGLYRGYSMSNNYDWIYAGYFKLETATTIDTIIGYYDENSGFDSNAPGIATYDMNIWSATQDDPNSNPNSWMPAVADFTGDIFSSKAAPGTFSWSDTGVDRVFPTWSGYPNDDIHRMVFTLDTPIVLPAGVYFFSHDAEVIPAPIAGVAGLALIGVIGLRRRR